MTSLSKYNSHNKQY